MGCPSARFWIQNELQLNERKYREERTYQNTPRYNRDDLKRITGEHVLGRECPPDNYYSLGKR